MGYKAQTRGSRKLRSKLDNDMDRVDLAEFDAKRVAGLKLKIWDLVLISQEGRRSNKLSKRYTVSYQVDKVLPNDRYESEDVDSAGQQKPVMACKSLNLWPNQGVVNDLMEENSVKNVMNIGCSNSNEWMKSQVIRLGRRTRNGFWKILKNGRGKSQHQSVAVKQTSGIGKLPRILGMYPGNEREKEENNNSYY